MTIDERAIAALLPSRPATAHKGQCGRVAIVAGSVEMAGAAVLCCQGALRAGAGLVYLCAVQELFPLINVTYPEIIAVPLASDKGRVTYDAVADVKQLFHDKKIDAVGMGPGLGRYEVTIRFMQGVMAAAADASIPAVLDADALYLIGASLGREHKEAFSRLRAVLTPHAGEFESLFRHVGLSREERRNAVLDAGKHFNKTIVLKGAGTVISDGHMVYENQTGNAGMASGGSGDVLTGILTTFVAQKDSLFDAAVLAVYLHGLAGDLAFQFHRNGLLPGDIVHWLGPALGRLESRKG